MLLVEIFGRNFYPLKGPMRSQAYFPPDHGSGTGRAAGQRIGCQRTTTPGVLRGPSTVAIRRKIDDLQRMSESRAESRTASWQEAQDAARKLQIKNQRLEVKVASKLRSTTQRQ